MDEHTEILPQLAAYHDGELTAAQKQKLENHLEICSACRQRLADWSALDRALLDLPEPGLAGDGLLADTLAEIKRREAPIPQRAVSTPRRAWILWPVAAAAVILLTAIGIMKLQTEKPLPVAETPGEIAQPERDLDTELAFAVTDSNQAIDKGAAPVPVVVADAVAPEREVEATRPAPAGDISEPAQIDPAPVYAKIDTTAPQPIAVGDSGIPQFDVWSARLFDSLEADPQLRLVGHQPTDFVELNVVPEFEVDFIGVSYAIRDLLAPHHEATLVEPQELGPEQTYLVSNLRMERAALMARSQNQIVSAEVVLRLAEITWSLANITADRDDVRSAIVAQTDAMRRQPQMAAQAKARLAHLAGLID